MEGMFKDDEFTMSRELLVSVIDPEISKLRGTVLEIRESLDRLSKLKPDYILENIEYIKTRLDNKHPEIFIKEINTEE